MGTRTSLAKLSREIYPGLEAIDQNVVSVDDNNSFTGSNTFDASPIPDYGNAIAQATATLTLAYATHTSRPVIQSVACVFTLPAVANLGAAFWIVNGAADGTLMTLAVNASDKFLWDIAGAAGTDDKNAINTAATAKKGDFIKVQYGSANGWIITEMGGIWVDEA